MISVLSVSVIPHLVHPHKAVDLPECIPPSASGIWGGRIGQVSNPPDSIGTAVQPQVVIERTNGPRKLPDRLQQLTNVEKTAVPARSA